MSEEHRGREERMVIDTSGMSEGQRQALEVTESARETVWKYPTFAGQMFMGRFDAGFLDPFPLQTEEDKRTGDEYIETISKFLRENLDPDEVDRTRTIPQDVIDGLFKLGIFAMKVPKEYNGLGFSQVNYNRVMQMIASYCGSTAVLVSAHQSIGVPQPLKMFGTDEQKKKYYPKFRENWISAFALTEPDVGSDPAKMATTAEPVEDGKYYIINGEKLWCTNGPIADVFVVMAQTPPKVVRGKERKQITAFVVERSFEGVEIAHRCDFMGLKAIENGLIRFRNVKVPAENTIWEPGKGLKLALATLNVGRLTLPAACTGMAKLCLKIVREWGNERVQWGAPIGKHQSGASKIAFIASHTLAMEAVTFLVSHWADRGDIDIRIEAAMAKYFCSEAAWKIIDQTMQFRGGRGYETADSLRGRGEKPVPVERMMRDCRINMIIEGTSEIMRLFLAREAMDPHLNVAADLVRPGTGFLQKLKGLGNVLAFYSKWYPSQWINGSVMKSYPDFGRLSGHLSYVDRTCHKLARSIFHAMGKYREKLEREQVLLGHFMDIGTELFAIAAVSSYARHLRETTSGDQTPVELADFFCRESRRRIAGHFRAVSSNDTPLMTGIAKRVLEGKLEWLEKGIVD